MTNTIGFFTMRPTADEKGLLGALLVTDELGKPEEFRVTYPIKPTPLQRQLYGESLVPHMGVELCGKPLLQALRNKLELLVVNDVRFLGLAKDAACPVVQVERLGEKLVVGGDSVDSEQRRGKMLSPTGRFSALAVNYPAECAEAQKAHADSVLQRFFAGIDLVEPFSRIEIAVRVLGEQDQAFR
jgi:hypothetical protein